ncbi:MAG: L-glutamate gamma-semialdehyde dehydrogenase [Trueperaceae bacterium]|nr:L-glutamate gamma-semialdehyde dehydrogenase [Trueperaceae bacterium]
MSIEQPLFEPYRNEPYLDYSQPEALALYQAALHQVKSELGHDYPLVIGGETIDTGDYLTSLNPSKSDEVVGRSAKAQPKEIDRAMDAAWDAYRSWSRVPMAQRARTLMKLAVVMKRRKLELCAWETFEAGKNYLEADADVSEAIDFVEYYARQSLGLADPLKTYDYPGEENTSFLQPIGVGVVIPPWNFLLAIMVGTAVGPVVVGNTVIVKPSPDTVIIAQKFMECVQEAGFPPGVINLVTGADADIGDYLVDHARTRFINFTGSMQTGMRIHERAAKVQPGQKWLKKTFLEMGGKDALIVDETADLDLAAQAAVASGFGFQGQKCSAMSRLIVVEEVYDELLERFVAGTNKLEMGPADQNPDLAAVINQRAVDKIMRYIDQGKVEARLVAGGERGDPSGYFIQPTIFADVPQSATIACEEIFGPVVAVMKAKDFDHALQIANSTMFGLTGGVISKDRSRLERAREEFDVGNLYLNRKITGALVGVQPFGGFFLSGTNAKAGGPDYLRLFMEMKTVTERF